MVFTLLAQSKPAPRYANNFRTLVSSLHFTAEEKKINRDENIDWMNEQTIVWSDTGH